MQGENTRSLFFRERLANLLAERGISQRQLAEATKLTPQSISNYIRGTRNLPAAEELYALSKYFGLTMESFLGADSTKAAGKTVSQVIATPLTPTKLRRIANRLDRIAEELKSQAKELTE